MSSEDRQVKGEPLVSVVMPARDAATTVSDAIESILDQSLTDWELIIVNDGSSDETESVIQGYTTTDARIRLQNSGGVGEAGARNSGLAEARGRWVAMMDADDVADPTRLSCQVHFLQEHSNLFGAASRAVLFVDRSRPLGLNAVDSPTTMEELQELKERGTLFTYSHPTLMLDREVLEEIGGYDDTFVQACDAELVNRAVYLHDLPILLMRESLMWQRLSPHGMSSKGLALQRRVVRYLEMRNLAWLQGAEPPTLQAYLSRPVPWRMRFRWKRHDVGALLYRRGGILMGEGHMLAALSRIFSAAVLHPRYVLAKLPRQRVGRRALDSIRSGGA